MSRARYGKPRDRTEKTELALLIGAFIIFLGGMLLLGLVNGWS